MTPRTKRPRLILTLLLILLALEALFLLPTVFGQDYRFGSPGTVDLLQYWTALELVRQGANPFDPEALQRLQSFFGVGDAVVLMRSPPWTLVLLAPILLLPFFTAALVWLILNIVLAAASALLLRKTYRDASTNIFLLALAAALFYPIWETVLLGQLSILLLFSMSVFLFAAERGKHLPAGLALAPLSIKPHLFLFFGVILCGWSIRHRSPRILLGAGLGLGLLIIGTYLLSPELIAQWAGSLASETTVAGAVPVSHWKTATLAGAVRWLIHGISGQAPLWPVYVIPACGLLGALIYSIKGHLPADWKELLPPVLCLTLLFAPYGWFFDQAILLILQVTLVIQAANFSAAGRRKVGLSLLLIQSLIFIIAVTGESSQHRFFWVPFVYLLLWKATEKVKA